MASSGRFRPVLLLIPLLAGSAYGAQTADGASLTIEPTWNGHFFPGSTTEIGVRLIAARGGEFKLRMTSQNTTTGYTGLLEPDRPVDLRLPVLPSSSEPVVVEVMRRNASMLRKEIRFTPSPLPLHAGIVETTPATPRTDLIHVSANRLPYTHQGYGTVESLRLNLATFSALSEEQSHALSNFLARCGKLELVNIDRETLRRIRGIGGCKGQAIRAADEPEVDQPADTAPTHPAAFKLNMLTPESENMGLISRLGLLAIGYLGFLILMERGTGNPRFLLVVPLLGCAFLILFWPLQESEAKIVNWFEMESGDISAYYTALLVIEPGGQGFHETLFSKRMGLPIRDDGGSIDLQLDARQPGMEVLRARTHPFAREYYGFMGSLQVSPLVILKTDRATPEVINRSGTQATQGYLYWSGEIYAIPPLAPGEGWSPSPSNLMQTRNSLCRLFETRSGTSSSALLIPYSLQDAGLLGPGIAARGWLLIKAGVPVT